MKNLNVLKFTQMHKLMTSDKV